MKEFNQKMIWKSIQKHFFSKITMFHFIILMESSPTSLGEALHNTAQWC